MQWGLSASYWKALKKARALFVNGLVTVWDIPLSANDRVSFPFLPEETDLVPEEGPLTILYEDEVLLAVHKEQGLLVHNSGLTQESSLSRRVLFYYREHGIKAARTIGMLWLPSILVNPEKTYIARNRYCAANTRASSA